MYNPRAACGSVQVYAVAKDSYALTTCPCYDNIELDLFDAGGPYCHFITSITIAICSNTKCISLS